jgi:hypothetical protein
VLRLFNDQPVCVVIEVELDIVQLFHRYKRSVLPRVGAAQDVKELGWGR